MTSILGVRTRGFLLFGAVATGLTACGAATPHDARPASAPGAARPAPAVAATRNGPVDQPSDRSADNSADKGWKLVWSPSAKKDGLDAFEGVENRGDGKRIFTRTTTSASR